MKSRFIVALALAAVVSAPAFADEYGKHPFYLHAISTLRAAEWQIDHRRPEDGRISQDEAIVHDEISAAINEFQKAAFMDGKGADWQPTTIDIMPRAGRLRATVDLLRKAHSDVAREEDDPRSRGFQQRGLQHVDAALNMAQHAQGDVRYRNMQRE
jgi:hypothetical protein